MHDHHDSTLDQLIEVRDSSIHGLGVFARRPIAAGVLIGCYEGPRVQEDGTYVLWIDCEEEGVYGVDGQNELRYVNHAARPNASFEGEELISLRPIAAGEEITFHYGEDWDGIGEHDAA
ncbi:MAG: SET domain-containing protein-lysine N-methyltransferase [Planctomycetes bacterium]|nr:SET domain-containing protein-lysine N-methyltransferase [Planctomycetota bacterium]